MYITVSTKCDLSDWRRQCTYTIYYVTKVLHEVELNYFTIGKFVPAVITVSWKLHPYFHEHKVEVLTDESLKNIIHNQKASGRLIKWAIELE